MYAAVVIMRTYAYVYTHMLFVINQVMFIWMRDANKSNEQIKHPFYLEKKIYEYRNKKINDCVRYIDKGYAKLIK